MKEKPKASTPTTGRRGRKPGGGVLKEIDPHGNYGGNLVKLVLGATAFNPLADLVREGRYLAKNRNAFVEQGEWDRRWEDFRNRVGLAAATALLSDNKDWFSAVAAIIKAEKKRDDQSLYPRQEALWRLDDGRWINAPPRHTIRQLCEELEKQGKRRAGQTDENWQRTVRRDCDQIGFPYLSDSPRAESNRHRFTPALLGLPSNFGKRSFWARNDLMRQLEDAQDGYRDLMKLVHPDKGGDAEKFRKVRRLWKNVEYQFKKHCVELKQ